MIVMILPNDLLGFTADAWHTKGSVLGNVARVMDVIGRGSARRGEEKFRIIFATMNLGVSCTRSFVVVRAVCTIIARGTSFLEASWNILLSLNVVSCRLIVVS